jgi:hypothetical protein
MANWVADFLTRNPDMAALPIALRAKHSIHFKLNARENIGQFVGAPCHFQDTDGLWKPLDTKLIAIGSEYGAPGLRTRLSKNGLVRVDGGTYSHISTRIGILNPTTKAFSSIKTIPNGSISGDQIIAETGVWKRVLTLTETGLREEIVISALPTGTGAGAGDWLVLETAISGVSFPDGWLADFSADGFMFPPPRTIDAIGLEAPCKRYARTVGGVQYIYTGVSVSWLADAVYPVIIDPDFTGSTADGDIYGYSGSYSTSRSTSSGLSITGSSLGVGRYAYPPDWFETYRGFLKFVTDSIPDSATITQVNQKLVCVTDDTETDFVVEIVEQDWSASDPITDGNRETVYDACLAAANHIDLGSTADIVIADGHYHFTSGNLTTGYVNKTGNTYYSLRSSLDKAGVEPTEYAAEYIALASQENTTEAYRPILTVVYSTSRGAGAAFLRMNLMGVNLIRG